MFLKDLRRLEELEPVMWSQFLSHEALFILLMQNRKQLIGLLEVSQSREKSLFFRHDGNKPPAESSNKWDAAFPVWRKCCRGRLPFTAGSDLYTHLFPQSRWSTSWFPWIYRSVMSVQIFYDLVFSICHLLAKPPPRFSDALVQGLKRPSSQKTAFKKNSN